MSTPLQPNETVSAQPVNNQKAPFISVKELRKVLGKDAEGLDDEKLLKVSVGFGKIALLLTNNPDLFTNLTQVKGDLNYGK